MNEHPWITEKQPKFEVDAYHRILISRGNIFCETDERKLVGYAEILKITPEQFGRIVLDRGFSATAEDSLSGDVAVVNHVWVDKEYRNSWVIKNLTDKFVGFTKDCKQLAGLAERKSKNMVKFFHRESLSSFELREALCQKAK